MVPEHTVVLPVTLLMVGFALTVTLVVAELTQPFALATVTVYVPLAAVVALVIDGFCEEDTKLLGPVHAYVVKPPDEVRLTVAPTQIGLLLPAVTTGNGFTVI